MEECGELTGEVPVRRIDNNSDVVECKRAMLWMSVATSWSAGDGFSDQGAWLWRMVKMAPNSICSGCAKKVVRVPTANDAIKRAVSVERRRSRRCR